MKAEQIVERLSSKYWLLYQKEGVYLCHDFRADGKDFSENLGLFKDREEAVKAYDRYRNAGSSRH